MPSIIQPFDYDKKAEILVSLEKSISKNLVKIEELSKLRDEALVYIKREAKVKIKGNSFSMVRDNDYRNVFENLIKIEKELLVLIEVMESDFMEMKSLEKWFQNYHSGVIRY